MYKLDKQLRFEDFVFSYGKLDKENEWVRLAAIIPWDRIEEMYAKKFVNNGHPAHPARMALGSLLIKQMLRCSDERPIVRGKVKANTEFGAKLHVSLEDGYGRIERLDFEAYNESEDLPKIVERYRERTGHYPKRLLADKIYRTRDNLAYCKEHGIRLSGPPLGRPRKDELRDRKSEYQDACERNAIEGLFGTGKRSYGLDVVMAKLQSTSVTVIMVAVMAMNLKRLILLRILYMLRGCLETKTHSGFLAA